MELKITIGMSDFEPWSGAVETWDKIVEHGEEESFEALAVEMFPDGCTQAELNDFLWFEDEWIFESLGIDDEDDEDDEDEDGE